MNTSRRGTGPDVSFLKNILMASASVGAVPQSSKMWTSSRCATNASQAVPTPHRRTANPDLFFFFPFLPRVWVQIDKVDSESKRYNWMDERETFSTRRASKLTSNKNRKKMLGQIYSHTQQRRLGPIKTSRMKYQAFAAAAVVVLLE